MSEIPLKWRDTTIRDVVRFEGGSQPPKSTFVYEPTDGYVRLIQTRDFRTDAHATFVPRNLAKKFCTEEDILIGRYGPPLFQVFRGLAGAYNVALIKAIPKNGVDRAFLYYALCQKDIAAYLESLSQRSGGQTGIEMDRLYSYSLPLPPLAEQRKIAAILSTWDEAIGTVEGLIVGLEQRKQGLMQQLLTGAVRFEEFAGSEWRTAKAGDIFYSVSKRNHGDEELLSATQEYGVIPRSMLETRVTMPDGSTNNYKLVEPGDFIISLRTFQGGIEYSQYRGLVSPAYTVLKPKVSIAEEFYRHLFKSRDFIGRLAVAVIGIRDGKQISYADFAAMKLAYPSIDEQRRIADVLCSSDEEIDMYREQLATLKRQKKGLIQRLLTGEVRVAV